MTITSIYYLIFLLVLYIIYNTVPKYKIEVLLLANILFYCFTSIKYVPIIIINLIFTYFMGNLIERSNYNIKIYLLSILLPLLSLVIFKNLELMSVSIQEFLSYFNFEFLIELKFLAPLGISFYTLQTISYLTDVYNKKIDAEKSFKFLAVYLTYFCTIVSGPIERYNSFKNEISKKICFNYQEAVNAILLIFIGIFKKVVIADRLGIYVDSVYNNIYDYNGLPLIIATMLFAIQLYCDFSGYIDVARGSSKLFGIKLIENFKTPYFSTSIQEFWQKWHISLSSFLKDYIYIPLGGSRISTTRMYLNIIIVFFISGLWHGMNITFIVWGLLHGIYQILERVIRNGKCCEGKLCKSAKMLITFILVDFSWVFFRANSLREAVYLIKNAFINIKISNLIIGIGQENMILIIIFSILFISYEFFIFKFNINIEEINIKTSIKWGIIYLMAIFIIIFKVSNGGQFIYGMF